MREGTVLPSAGTGRGSAVSRLRDLFGRQGRAPLRPYDVYRMGIREAAGYSCVAAGTAAVFSYLFYNSAAVFLAAAVPTVLLFLSLVKKKKVRDRKEALKKQFLSACTILGDLLRSGYAVESAVLKSTGDLSVLWGENSDIVKEWKVIGAGLSYNHPVEELFSDFAERTGIREIGDFAELFSVVNRTGGQVTEVLKSRTDMMKEACAAGEQIETVLTAKRFEQRIMDVTPLLILLYIRFTSPELIGVLYNGITGRLIMTGALLVYAGAFVWAEKIAESVKMF